MMKILDNKDFQVHYTYRDKKGKVVPSVLSIPAIVEGMKELSKRVSDIAVDYSLSEKERKTKTGALKSNLPAALFSCTTDGSKDNITGYRPLMLIDIDGFYTDAVFNSIKSDSYTYLAFKSPSGIGIKAIFKLDFLLTSSDLLTIQDYHLFSFNKIREYCLNKWGISMDESGKNINRLCYLGSGPGIGSVEDVYINESSDKFPTMQDWVNSNNSVQKTSTTTSNSTKSVNNTSHNSYTGGGQVLIKKALDYFNETRTDAFDDYGDWLKLGFLIYKNFKEKGFEIFNDFSMLGNKYDPKSVKNQWWSIEKSFNIQKVGSEKFILKKMTDYGYIIKANDSVLRKFQWDESDYDTFRTEMNFSVIIDDINGDPYLKFEGKDPVKMTDMVFNQLITDLRLKYSTKLKDNVIRQYMFSENNINRVNFIKEKLESIETDLPYEFEKIKSGLTTAEGSDLAERIIKRWMLGSMKNIFDTYYDEILCLKGGQGLGKTTFVTNYFLKPFSKWTTNSFNWDMKSADQVRQLVDNWFVYDMENTSMTKNDTKLIKNITSKSTVTFRTPYDKFPNQYKRISSFITDTNEDHVFNDNTGGRRYLILTLESMNIYDKDGGFLKLIDYDKVWGYIYHLYKSGVRHDSIDISDIEIIRDRSRLKSDLEELVGEIFTVSETQTMTCSEVENIINTTLLTSGKRSLEGGYTKVNIGKALSKFKKKYVKIDKKTQLVYFMKKISNVDIEVDDLSKTEADQYVDTILDKMNSGEKLTDEMKEILKNLR